MMSKLTDKNDNAHQHEINIMKINKYSLISWLVFCLSPLAIIPSIFIQLNKKKDVGIGLLTASLFAVLSFNYIPNITNDKARYIAIAKSFSTYSFNDLLTYFDEANKPDYIFNLLMFFFSRIDSGFNYFFFTLTFLTVFLLFSYVKNTLKEFNCFNFDNRLFIFFICSISLGTLFSGVRFYFGASLILYSFYYLYTKEDKTLFVVFFLLAITTHFSLLFFIIPVLFSYIKISPRTLRLILAISIIGFWIPKDFIGSSLTALNFSSGINAKIEIYSEWSRDASFNSTILQSIRTLWYFLAIIFLFLHKKSSNIKLYSITITTFIFINLISPIGITFERFSLVASFIFLTYVLNEHTQKKIKPWCLNAFIFFYFLSTLVDIYLLRLIFIDSYSASNMLTLFHVFINGGVQEISY